MRETLAWLQARGFPTWVDYGFVEVAGFLAWLAREHPELVPKYRIVYGEGTYARKDYREWLGRKVRPILRAEGLLRAE